MANGFGYTGSVHTANTMPEPGERQITQILHDAAAGDPRAGEQLLPLVYEELRRLAHSAMRKERGAQTLQPTALVHEAYLRLVGGDDVSWNSRGHFFGAAALAMRRILVERARHRRRIKHGGGVRRVELAGGELAEQMTVEQPEDGTDLVALDAALDRLAEYDRRKCDVVMLKYFAGLTNDEVSAALGVSSATVRNDWTFAKAFLKRELDASAAGTDGMDNQESDET